MGLISNVKNSVTKSFNNTMKKVETVATNVKNEVVKTAKEAAKETKVAVKNLVVDPFKKALNDTGQVASLVPGHPLLTQELIESHQVLRSGML
ncbi:hypothetical protein [Paenibacillus sp. Soil522]|uniref:hypothetical protein n=1 Tax=Paenibacillus sp. Soil522 TaxID=1736388 RepID=UPI0006FF4198|nr:hypothetical protein [Paenibacillus sp. Soil522]KRE22704.1 hypothetical protein ASG81_28495 [Paenibacillus sp. Soil522]